MVKKPLGAIELDLPESWDVRQLRHCARIAEGQVDPTREPFESMALIAPNHIESGTGRLESMETARDQAAISGKYLLGPEDVVYSKIRPSLRKACFPQQDALCSADMYPLRPAADIEPKWLLYNVLSDYFSNFVLLSSDRVAMPKVNRDALNSCPIIVAPMAEQRQLVHFLDRETAKIDHLIEQKERLLELLQEKRTALITRAVTRGLDPDVEMKDSGVEWLGEIPMNWEVSPVKFVSSFVTSGSRGWSQYYSDDGPTFVRIGNLAAGSIDLDMRQRQAVEPPPDKEAERSRVRSGDVLVSITALIGAVGVVPPSLGEAYVNQHVALVRPRDTVNPRWLAYCLLSRVGQAQFDRELYGGTKEGLSLDDVREVRVLLPPIETQSSVVTYLDEQLVRLSELVETIKHAITLLREYRTALISAAVTGKIDVRNSQEVA